jgi:hypothetical protein
MVMSAGGPMPPGAPQVKSLNCPSCGASLTVRSFGQAVTVVCASCHSVLDAQDPRLTILQKFKVAEGEDQPLIPLGTRGSIRGTVYEAIGFQRRTIVVEGIHYSWHEYVLFNPYKGFRYLTEYDGHWNDVSLLRSLPDLSPGASSLRYLGETYKQFQSSNAATTFVLGEFPWQVRVGESVDVTDYVSPPRVISSERTGKEVSWSMGEYVAGRDIWKAFKLQGEPPVPIGVYENQPSPLSASTKTVWGLVLFFLVIMVALMVGINMLARNEEAFEQTFEFNTNAHGEPSFVTDPFELKGRTSDVELTTSAQVNNDWIYLNYALINQDTGHAYDFGREISYYHGYDSDGYWSEGGTKNSVTLSSIPSGTYYLRIEPESDPNRGTIAYTVTLKRDVPQASFFWLGALALLLPAVIITWRSLNFEHLRWAESDYGGAPDDGSLLSVVESVSDSIKKSSGDDE